MKVQSIRIDVVEEQPHEIHAEHVELLPNNDLAVMTMVCVGLDRQSESWICSTMHSAYQELRDRHPNLVPGRRHTILKTKVGVQWRIEEFYD
ncbi:MAG TPA: hypothetical protein V6C89_04870 [Drouetiella sp.]|jgi:hypothetical protein